MLKKNMVSENFDSLFEAAKKVREQAHVPYSHFKALISAGVSKLGPEYMQ